MENLVHGIQLYLISQIMVAISGLLMQVALKIVE